MLIFKVKLQAFSCDEGLVSKWIQRFIPKIIKATGIIQKISVIAEKQRKNPVGHFRLYEIFFYYKKSVGKKIFRDVAEQCSLDLKRRRAGKIKMEIGFFMEVPVKKPRLTRSLQKL